jgi:hypothetical protein
VVWILYEFVTNDARLKRVREIRITLPRKPG